MKLMNANVPGSDVGIARPMMTVERHERRNRAPRPSRRTRRRAVQLRVGDRALDVLGAVERDLGRMLGRRLELVSRSRTAFDTSTVLAPDRGAMPGDGDLAAPPREAPDRLESVLDPRDVPEPDRSSLAHGHDHVLERGHVRDLALDLDDRLARAGLERAARDLDVLGLERADDLPGRKPVPFEPLAVDPDPDLAFLEPAQEVFPTPSTVWSRGRRVQRAYSPIARASGPMSAIQRFG
jgi:hypothetical protein